MKRDAVFSRRDFLKAAGFAGVALGAALSGVSFTSCRRTPQVTANPPGVPGQSVDQLDGATLNQFADPLPKLRTIIAGDSRIELRMEEFRYNVLPTGFKPASGEYSGTWVWGYREAGQSDTPSYIGPVIVATRGKPTQVKYVNNLGNTSSTRLEAYKHGIDQTLHWADPLNDGANAGNMEQMPGASPESPWDRNYAGPIPAVVHLHGGEVPPVLDGGPEQWYTPDASHSGRAYYGGPNSEGNASVFRYPNTQQAAPLWFHDHTLGATRLNVYCGMAGAYLLVDPSMSLPPNLPGPADIVPLVIQDRKFDINGQLYFPSDPNPNPEHPFWVPEFLGDTIVVNGKVWPYLEVEPRRYRFLFLNGSNARTYRFSLPGDLPIWVIGNDGGYLDAPASIKELLMMPGERYEVIIDFATSRGKTLILKNDANSPFPDGDAPPPASLGRIIQFRVGAQAMNDGSYDPASATPLRSGSQKMVRLTDAARGALAAGVTVAKTRALTLNEVMTRPVSEDDVDYEGGPNEVLLNNTGWDGMRKHPQSGEEEPVPGGVSDGYGSFVTEMPIEGETEIWELINLTADAHPIHLHLAQFQILNRQNFDLESYLQDYGALFSPSVQLDPDTGQPYTGGAPIAQFGPPLDYAPSEASGGKYGGNPRVEPYLHGSPEPPGPHEVGWKDTVIAQQGMVTRIAVRWAPTDKPLDDPALRYPFDPSAGGRGYVWHCHIIDHEDNEMMRPTVIQANTSASRSYVMGKDY